MRKTWMLLLITILLAMAMVACGKAGKSCNATGGGCNSTSEEDAATLQAAIAQEIRPVNVTMRAPGNGSANST